MPREQAPELFVGKMVFPKRFCYTNKHGGTGLSDSTFEGDPVFPHAKIPACCVITKLWHDYETGINTWCAARGQATKGWLRKYAHPQDQRMFVSEFDLIGHEQEEGRE